MTDYKGLIDHYKTCDKEELIEKLVVKNAQLRTCEKEGQLGNEYIQIMELEEISKKL